MSAARPVINERAEFFDASLLRISSRSELAPCDSSGSGANG
jgi:hypothetical protein